MMSEFRCVDTHSLWTKTKPERMGERYRLLRTEGEKCFLFPHGTPHDPGRPHYPICNKEGCLSCSGLQAAYKRLSLLGKYSEAYKRVVGKGIEEAKEEAIRLALRYADPSDPTNKCNWAIRAAKKKGIIPTPPRIPLGGGLEMAKCVAWQEVYSPALGKYVRRCARFAGVGELGEVGDVPLGQPTGQRCVSWKRVYSPALGKYVRRCAEFAGTGELGETYVPRSRRTRRPRRLAGLGKAVAPGECARTKGGVVYCYFPGRGVRFVGKRVPAGMREV